MCSSREAEAAADLEAAASAEEVSEAAARVAAEHPEDGDLQMVNTKKRLIDYD